jgi:hypothetical protein
VSAPPNRHLRRVSDAAVKRGQPLSAALLQDQLAKLAAEGHQKTTALIAIVKTLGRVRVSRETINALTDNDGIEVKETGPDLVFEYRAGVEMVTPRGVTNGEGNEPKETA